MNSDIDRRSITLNTPKKQKNFEGALGGRHEASSCGQG